MNFLAHYYLDSHSADSLFVIGLVTPDLISLYDRGVRFRERDIRQAIEGKQLNAAENSLFQGVLRHFEADGIFHDSAFFKDESSLIARRLREDFPQYEVKRSFFVGHVLFELCLDRLLMETNPGLSDSFYSNFRKYDPELIADITSVLAGRPLPGYSDFLIRFLENPYIPRYKNPDYIVRVLRRILSMVGIGQAGYAYLDDENFEKQMLACEGSLNARFEAGLDSIKAQLRPL